MIKEQRVGSFEGSLCDNHGRRCKGEGCERSYCEGGEKCEELMDRAVCWCSKLKTGRRCQQGEKVFCGRSLWGERREDYIEREGLSEGMVE